MSRPFCLEGKKSRGMSLFFVMGFGQWCGWMVKGLERTQLEHRENTVVKGRPEEGICGEAFLCAQKEDVSFMNAPQQMTSAEMRFNS